MYFQTLSEATTTTSRMDRHETEVLGKIINFQAFRNTRHYDQPQRS